jgi:hypothetical protein
MTLYFVTPAYGRLELSEVCFDQRVNVIETLAEYGIEAKCVVIADDGNLDLARDRGFDVVVQNNRWLGRKFNDGIEYAFCHGASRVIPIGSDSWIDPAYFLPLPPRNITRTASSYCVVTADRLGTLQVTDTNGVGPYILDRQLLRSVRYRPAKDQISHGVDGSTIRGIRHKICWKRYDLHPFQYVGFRGTPSLNTYSGLMAAWGVAEHTDPWMVLRAHYPADLVARAQAVMTRQALMAA